LATSSPSRNLIVTKPMLRLSLLALLALALCGCGSLEPWTPPKDANITSDGELVTPLPWAHDRTSSKKQKPIGGMSLAPDREYYR
jgi:hypothetical protein